MNRSVESDSWEIVEATSPEELDAARALFREYAEFLGESGCFQGFDRELTELPGSYAPPNGRLLLARRADGDWGGMIALRPFDEAEPAARVAAAIGEVKRLYVRPSARGARLGRRLVERLMFDARSIGYRRLRLDTLERLQTARALYVSLGFVEIEPYDDSPEVGLHYYERELLEE